MSQPRPNSRMVERGCPVCGSRAGVEFLRKQELRLQRCGGCSMIYVGLVPVEFASGEYYDLEAAGYYLSPAKLESDYAAVRFRRELRLFRKHCERGQVLDVGCSSGGFLYQLTKLFPRDYQVVGTDASGPALEHAEKQGIPILRGDFLELDKAGKSFDAVTFWAVLEHVAEPATFLDQAYALLNEGGLCFVLVPNFGSLATRVLRERYRYIYPQHLNYFTRNTLQKLVRKRFEIVEVRYTHFNPIVIWQDWRRNGAEVPNEARAQLLRQTTAYKQNLLLKPVRLLYQAGEAILAQLGLADNLAMVLRKR